MNLTDQPVVGNFDSSAARNNGGGKKKAANSGVGGGKANLNHLLNFTYESYRDPTRDENYYEYERFTKQFWSMKLSKSTCFSKEQFLLANCQFVVKNTGDYTVHMCEPDRLVDWDLIEEIQIETLEAISCPICLYEPVSAKMSKCGHIYCWPCMLHYLSLSDKSWRKCPICYESIYKKDLKSVRVLKHDVVYKTGDSITLNLMFKYKNKFNTIFLPASMQATFLSDEKEAKSGVTYDMFKNPAYTDCRKYFKLHSKSAQDIHCDVIQRERRELTTQAEIDKDQPEVCFVAEALVLLDDRENGLKEEMMASSCKKGHVSQRSAYTKPKVAESTAEKTVISEVKPEIVYSDPFNDVYVKKEELVESEPVKNVRFLNHFSTCFDKLIQAYDILIVKL